MMYDEMVKCAYEEICDGIEKEAYHMEGVIKKDLKLSDRVYKCECGNVIDRDFQAALNLKQYGENVLKRSVA